MVIKIQKVNTKYLAILIAVIILIIPASFGVYIEFLRIGQLNYVSGLLLVIGFLVLLIIGKLNELYILDNRALEQMRNHDVINALLNKNNKVGLILFFPLTMIMEELIFRYYLVGLFFYQLKIGVIFSILVSSVIFSLYHIHIWFRLKNKRILIAFLLSSFFIGVYLSYTLFTLGITMSVIAHLIIVFIFYYGLYRKLMR